MKFLDTNVLVYVADDIDAAGYRFFKVSVEMK